MQWDKVREIEEKWNVTFEFMNLTFSGANESINTSIMAGARMRAAFPC